MFDLSVFTLKLQDLTPHLSLFWCLGLLAFGLTIKPSVSTRSRKNLPPGPSGLPLLGNVFQIPRFQWFRFTEWNDQYGPIFSLNLAGQTVVVINSHKIVADLFDRRSSLYSDRPQFIVGDLLTGGLFLGFMRYTELWRKLRRAGHEGLNVRAAEHYQPTQEREAAILAAALVDDPDAWHDHLKRLAASTVLSAIYALPPIESKDDPLVARINSTMYRLVQAALPGRYLVEIFPVMQYLPTWMAKWKREALEWHQKDTEMFESFMDGVREKLRTGDRRHSFATTLIENDKRHNLTKKESSWLAGTMFGGGTETTAAVLVVFMLAMRLYPDVMRKGQAEIDAVVGRDRLPTFADCDNLPYVSAIIKEVLRWRPVTPLGGPRRTTQGNWYEGYYIPKGTVVLANVWGMNRDPSVYPDFDEFRPERFLDEFGKLNVIPCDTHGQGHVSYGFGKRICLGMHVANQSLFIVIASVLWAVNINKAFDENGAEIIPSRTACIDDGIVVRPVPFECKISPRSTDVREILEIAKARQV